MRVRILRPRVLQHAGAEIPLVVGRVEELATPIAESLIATGAAEAAPVVVQTSAPADEVDADLEEEAAARRAPEAPLLAPPETKVGRPRGRA